MKYNAQREANLSARRSSLFFDYSKDFQKLSFKEKKKVKSSIPRWHIGSANAYRKFIVKRNSEPAPPLNPAAGICPLRSRSDDFFHYSINQMLLCPLDKIRDKRISRKVFYFSINLSIFVTLRFSNRIRDYSN